MNAMVVESPWEVCNKETREQMFRELYEDAFPTVARFVVQMSGSLQDAKDIFQDALIIFYEKNSEEQLVIHSSPKAYLLGIAKHLWIRKYKKDRAEVMFDEVEAAISIPEDYFPTPADQRLLRFLEHAGKKCLDLLQAFYYEKLPLAGIARTFGYTSVHSATVQKYKCLEKVRDKVKEKAVTYEDFFE